MTGHDGNDDTPTRAELAELRQGLDDLADSIADLRKASTAGERKAARADVADAEDDLEATARRLGVSKEKLQESITAAKKAERRDELKPILEELLDELLEPDDDTGDDDDTPAPAKKKPAAKKPAAAKKEPADDDAGDAGDDDGPLADSEPLKPHWSEAPLGGILR